MFIRENPILSLERMVVRIMIARVKLQKESLIAILEGHGAKTN
jgi:hypothetical protein